MRFALLLFFAVTAACRGRTQVRTDPAPDAVASTSVSLSATAGVAEPSFEPAPVVLVDARPKVARPATVWGCEQVLREWEERMLDRAGACSTDDDCSAHFLLLSKSGQCTSIAANHRQVAVISKLVDEARSLGCAVKEDCPAEWLVRSLCTNGACRYR